MQPEISRRCGLCGASIREANALFCPDCGHALTKSAEPAKVEVPEEAVANTAEVPVQKDFTAPAVTPQSAPSSDRHDRPASVTAEKDPAGESAKVSEVQPTPPTTKVIRPESERGRLHRASSMARGVIEDEVKRVEKIRHVSSAMFEEASYDPSLRFVLVALGIFIVFIILLVLSKVMG